MSSPAELIATRPWLKHYPAGVPFEVDVSRYSSLPAMAEEAFAKFGDRAAFTCKIGRASCRERV